VSSTAKKQTYGGLPVSDEYLARYGVASDQEVYATIARVLAACAMLAAFGAGALWIWA